MEAQPQECLEPSNKSTGPRTEEGRRRSSLNARRHQLTAKTYIAPPEEMESYDAHFAAWREALKPVGTEECELVEEISRDKWRLKRAAAIEQSIFAQGHIDYADSIGTDIDAVNAALAEAKTWKEASQFLQNLTLYESRLRRAVEKNELKLESLQQTRKQAYNRALHDAITLTQEASSRGEEYDPGDDFEPAANYGEFVYSSDLLDRYFDRQWRLNYKNRPKPQRDEDPKSGQKAA